MPTRQTLKPDRYVSTMSDEDEDIYCSDVPTDEWVSSSSEEEESTDTEDEDFIDDSDDSDYVQPHCCCNCPEK